MKIRVQDKDRTIKYDPSKPLYTMPVIIDGKEMGINLMYESVLLGTFDTVELAMLEIQSITHSNRRIYQVSGYSNYDGKDEFRKLVGEWTHQDEIELKAWCQW